MMHTVGVSEATTQLTELLHEVEAGGEVTITRHGKPVARLIPVASNIDREKARLAAEGLKHLSKGLTPGELIIRDVISEVRR